MLIQQFRYDNYRLHQLGNNSVFTITLQAGLSAIKTPYPLCSNIPHPLSFYVVTDHLNIFVCCSSSFDQMKRHAAKNDSLT